MRRWQTVMASAGLLALGYVAGSSGLSLHSRANAQDAPLGKPSPKLTAAVQSLADAAESLKADGHYETITQGTNAFLVLSGGGNARADLESGSGVDPETYGALYAGLAIPELQDQIAKDDNGRLTFNGQLIQMYSKSKLQKVYANRLKLAGTR
jgi:hypothetical protein